MNSLLVTLMIWSLLVGFIAIATYRATEDGFFISLWTAIVLLAAYHFARLEWDFFFQLLRGNGMGRDQAASMGYWIGFLIVVAPGMLAARFLSRPKVPFPYLIEKYGSMGVGVGLGVLLFATVIQWLLSVGFLPPAMREALRSFGPLFRYLGYRSAGFE
jgi:hypothetical protein